MKIKLCRVGDGLAVRIPKGITTKLNLREGEAFELTLMEGGLLLRRQCEKYRLDDLLAQITPANIHEETDWGPSVEREAW